MMAAAPQVALGQAVAGPDSAALARVRDLIRQSNPELEARRAAVAAAEARVPAAGVLGPAVLSAEVEEIPDGLDVTEAGSFRLDLSRELSGGGRRAASRAVAGQAVARARLELAMVERGLIAQAEGLLVHYLGSIAIAERLSGQDSLLTRAEEGVTTRFAVGESRYVDVLRLRAERLRTRAEIAQSRSEALRSRRILTALAGPSDSTVRRLTTTLDRLAGRALAAMDALTFPAGPSIDSLVAISSPVQLSEVTVQAAVADLRLTQAEQRTRVNASVGIQRFGAENGKHRVGPTLGASITLPFTARGAARATRLAAERNVLAARAEQRAALSQARAFLGAARDRYEAAVANAALFEAGLMRGVREERENALASYRTGALSLLELLDFERALTQAEVSQNRSRIAASEALANLLAGAACIPDHTLSSKARRGASRDPPAH
ncbi:MAG: TolC family protein [Gemmatimonadales bacterium]|nr:TolC family protein [Gemmatimonadales bacterium]